MTDVKFDGLGVALATPFNEDYSIDYESLGKLIDNVVGGGCDFIVALGTTAETPTLTSEEKKKLSRFIVECVSGRLPLLIGIGGNNTMAIINEIKNYNLEGYTALLSVTPYYNKPSQEGLFKHFETISQISPLPILLYNVPGRTGVNMTAETTLRLAQISDKFCGIKESSGDMLQCKEIIARKPESFKVISGDDIHTFDIMQAGGCGVISVLANALPSEMKKLVNLCKSENYAGAQLWQERLKNINRHLFQEGNPSGIKALLNHLGICKNILRLPLVPVGKVLNSEIKEDLLQLQNHK